MHHPDVNYTKLQVKIFQTHFLNSHCEVKMNLYFCPFSASFWFIILTCYDIDRALQYKSNLS